MSERPAAESSEGTAQEALRPGVLFDVDGTLLDTNYLHVMAWTRACRETGHEDVTMAQVHRGIGIASRELIQRLTGGEDEATAAAYSTHYERLQGEVRPFEAAGDLVRACHDLGLAVVLATSGKEDDLEWMLPAIGVDDHVVDGSVTSSDVEASKPAPELFEVALVKCGLDPERTIAIGDTVWDCEAAGRAGLPVVAVECGGIAEHELREAGACEVYADPADLLANLTSSRLATLSGPVG